MVYVTLLGCCVFFYQIMVFYHLVYIIWYSFVLEWVFHFIIGWFAISNSNKWNHVLNLVCNMCHAALAQHLHRFIYLELRINVMYLYLFSQFFLSSLGFFLSFEKRRWALNKEKNLRRKLEIPFYPSSPQLCSMCVIMDDNLKQSKRVRKMNTEKHT